MRYPTLYMYLVRLPDSVASYPEVQTLSDLPLIVKQRWPDLVDRSDLPPDVVAAIQAPLKPGQWVSEVVFMTLNALVRDIIYRNDEGYLQFCYDTMKSNYESAFMRAVMHFFSPSLLAMSGSKRWAMLKKGTTITTLSHEKTKLSVSLTYPPNMYHKCMLEGFAKSFQAGIDCTRARNCIVHTLPKNTTECRFDIHWEFD